MDKHSETKTIEKFGSIKAKSLHFFNEGDFIVIKMAKAGNDKFRLCCIMCDCLVVAR